MPQPNSIIDPSEFACAECGYDLSGTPVGGACPECGSAVMDSITRAHTDRISVSALICMVLGILSMGVIPLVGIVAIVWYAPAKREVVQGLYSTASMRMTTTGLVTGIIGTALILLMPLGFRYFW